MPEGYSRRVGVQVQKDRVRQPQLRGQELKEQVPELFTLMASQQTSANIQSLPLRQNNMINNKSELLQLYFEVITAEMDFRNFTLRLYTRMLQINDNLASGSIMLNEAQ